MKRVAIILASVVLLSGVGGVGAKYTDAQDTGYDGPTLEDEPSKWLCSINTRTLTGDESAKREFLNALQTISDDERNAIQNASYVYCASPVSLSELKDIAKGELDPRYVEGITEPERRPTSAPDPRTEPEPPIEDQLENMTQTPTMQVSQTKPTTAPESPQATTLAQPTYRKLDFDGDGRITITDVGDFSAAVIGDDQAILSDPAYDLNGDGTVSLADVKWMAIHFGIADAGAHPSPRIKSIGA